VLGVVAVAVAVAANLHLCDLTNFDDLSKRLDLI